MGFLPGDMTLWDFYLEIWPDRISPGDKTRWDFYLEI